MLGRTHAVSGAVGWLAGCAAVSAAGAAVSTHAIVVGALVAAGSALVPDIDHPESTVSRSLGLVTGLLAAGVYASSAWLRQRSCAHCGVRRPRGGHRAVTHTAVFPLTVGGLLSLAGWLTGPAGGLPVVWLATALAVRGVLSRRTRGTIGAAVAATLAVAAASAGSSSWWWVGLPVAWGILAHSLGDSATMSGAPLLWPLRVRGCRWAPMGTPRSWRFRTGRAAERAVWWVLLVAGLASLSYLAAG